MYRRLTFIYIYMLYQVETIIQASKNLNINRKTGGKWLKQYNEMD